MPPGCILVNDIHIARVPLASGLLTGKLRRDTRFAADDHRQYNRQGEAFDVGETFSGVPYETGVEALAIRQYCRMKLRGELKLLAARGRA
ncbi:hypothetical protein [Cystobacter fuscus]|uniref:hypothetical protein n=1 Tax=Cystobacter fuscus TaxID=43 RepID=UPI0018DF99B9|nr:hypothetical protein [Cystobacter fuscus]